MSSNTKLSRVQKAWRKEMIAALPYGSMLGHAGAVTVLMVPAGNTFKMATSVASPDEKKVRRKVGGYMCLVRLQNEQYIPIPRNTDDSGYAQAMAEYLAA